MDRHRSAVARPEYVQFLLLPLLAVASLRLWRPAFGWVSHGQARYQLINGMHGVFRTAEVHRSHLVPRGALLLALVAIALVVATTAFRLVRRSGRAALIG